MSLLSEFKDFMLTGDVIALAVAFIIGAAFNSVVTALVTDLFTPIIGIPGHISFNSITYTVNGSVFLVGPFINSLISFIVIALAVFFLIVKPVNKLKARMAPKAAPAPPATKDCPECCSKIPINAKRCPFCTSKLH